MPKNQSQKLRLENFIFARAAYLTASVYGIRGQLYSPCLEPYLQVGIFFYNTCFASVQVYETSFFTRFVPPVSGVKNGWILPPFFQ